MPKIKSMKYFIGNTDWQIADVTIPYEMYEKLNSDELDIWLRNIATSCPLYIDAKDEVTNHIGNFEPAVVIENDKPF